MKLTLIHDGVTYTEYDIDALAEAGVPKKAIAAALEIHLSRQGHQLIDTICDELYTQSPSRSERYARKYDEALRFKSAGYPSDADADDYPFLLAEAAVLGLTTQDQANRVIAAGLQFSRLGSIAEAARAGLSKALSEAGSTNAKLKAFETAIQNFKTGLASIQQEA